MKQLDEYVYSDNFRNQPIVFSTEYGQAVRIVAEELEDDWLNEVIEISNDAKEIFEHSMLYNGSIRHMIVALIYSVILNLPCLAEVKEILNTNYDYKNELIKATIDDLLNNEQLMVRVEEITQKYGGSYERQYIN